jgi:hypothetical protein
MKRTVKVVMKGSEIVDLVHDRILQREKEDVAIDASELERALDGEREYEFEIKEIGG